MTKLEDQDQTFWVVRPGRSGGKKECEQIENTITTNGFIGLDDPLKIGVIDTETFDSRKMRNAVARKYPDMSPATISAAVSNAIKFATVISVGDFVLSPSRIEVPRIIKVGQITSDYSYVKSSLLPHQRNVHWLGHIAKDDLATEIRRELGAARLFFECKRSKSAISKLVSEIA